MTELRTLSGLGPKIEKELKAQQILTLEALAAVTDVQLIDRLRVMIPTIGSLILKAKQKVSGATSATAAAPPTVTLGGAPPLPAVVEENKSIDLKEFWLETHSWFEASIVLPRSRKARERMPELCNAIIYDLCLEPNQRISFQCGWIPPDSGEKILCTKTYSPQFIYFFNHQRLPPLTVDLHPDDLERFPRINYLKNVLEEIQMMGEF